MIHEEIPKDEGRDKCAVANQFGRHFRELLSSESTTDVSISRAHNVTLFIFSDRSRFDMSECMKWCVRFVGGTIEGMRTDVGKGREGESMEIGCVMVSGCWGLVWRGLGWKEEECIVVFSDFVLPLMLEDGVLEL